MHPELGVQTSVVQLLPSSHVRGPSASQRPLSQASPTVQASPSEHALPSGTGSLVHPSWGSQSVVHGLSSSQASGVPRVHRPPSQVSVPSHTSPSSHSASLLHRHVHCPGSPRSIRDWSPRSPGMQSPGQAPSPAAALASHCSPGSSTPFPQPPARTTVAPFESETLEAMRRPVSVAPRLSVALPLGTRTNAAAAAPRLSFSADPPTSIWTSPGRSGEPAGGPTYAPTPAVNRPTTMMIDGSSASRRAPVPSFTPWKR